MDVPAVSDEKPKDYILIPCGPNEFRKLYRVTQENVLREMEDIWGTTSQKE